MKISLTWLQTYFKEKLPAVDILADKFTFHLCEVESIETKDNDTIIDVNILPNRAHDCLCHRGIAKEVAAFLKTRIIEKEIQIEKGEPTQLALSIQTPLCRRYMARVIKNVSVKESPQWLKDKIGSIGQKSINNIVDAANFVLFDIGQPIHVFDTDKLKNEKIFIRAGKKGESMTTLDGKEIEIDESILLIADQESPLAIAGVKGGNKAEVDKDTKNIVIEVANFDPVSVRKTARRLGLFTDAAKRFENDLTPSLCAEAMEQITSLIIETAGGTESVVEEMVDIYPHQQIQTTVEVALDLINKKLGTHFSTDEIEEVWKELKFSYTKKENIFIIQIPIERLDLSGPHDLVEEVGRLIGYDHVLEVLPKINFTSKINETVYKIFAARHLLLDRGYSEVMTYTLEKKGEFEVAHGPKGKSFLRTNISDGLKESVSLNIYNLPILKMKEVKIFEIGTVFKKNGEEIHIAYGDRKVITEMTLEEFCTKEEISVGENYLLPVAEVETKKFSPWSPYPFIVRDISVWMNQKNSEETIKKEICEILPSDLVPYGITVIDSFEKEGKISKTFRIIFQSNEKTLTDIEVEGHMRAVDNKISNLGLQIR